MIAITPGNAWALETSMRLIIACGSWLRRILQESMRGNAMSSANFVWPVHFARASTLRKGLPTTFKGFPLLVLILYPRAPTEKQLSPKHLQSGRGHAPAELSC